MANIFIHGGNSRVGGGRSILTNYVKLLNASDEQNNYYILVPKKSDYINFQSSSIIIIELEGVLSRSFMAPLVAAFFLPRLLKFYKINLLLNFSDIPVITHIHQIFLFDWPYAIYPNSKVWRLMDVKGYLIRKFKLFFFKHSLKYVDRFLVQTEIAKLRMKQVFNVENVQVVPNAVSVDNSKNVSTKDYGFSSGVKLLYLTHYYVHKNIEVFLPLALLIKKRGLNFKLIITIAEDQGIKAQKLLDAVRSYDLGEVIINIGAVAMSDVPQLYKQVDGLLMPTLLESFSGVYVEAMYHGIPIITSDLDFAHDVCGSGAEYFDPEDAESILRSIEKVFNNESRKKEIIMYGAAKLTSMSNWTDVFGKIQDLIRSDLSRVCS